MNTPSTLAPRTAPDDANRPQHFSYRPVGSDAVQVAIIIAVTVFAGMMLVVVGIARALGMF